MILRWVIFSYLYLQNFFQKITKTGPFGANLADYILGPYKNNGNILKDGMFKHHIKQFNGFSCSVASVVSVVNTLMDSAGTLNGHPVTQQAILEKVKTAHWKERMGNYGYKGRRGITLNILGQLVKTSLDAYEIVYKSVETVQALRDPKQSRKIKQTLRSRLGQFESKGNCLIISHFDQGCYVQDLHIPHISPVGEFDPATEKVTLLDVDPSQPHPYQISFDTFYKGLSSNYNVAFRMFGYGEGGYIYILL